MKSFSLFGTAFHSPACGEIAALEDVLIEVSSTGQIETIRHPGDETYEDAIRLAASTCALVRLRKGQYLLPGMIDLHVHAPQWPQLGKALDAPLEEWLNRYTFPLEAKYSDLAFARSVYDSLVRTLVQCGTTTAVYYGSIHTDANLVLAEACIAHGQRAFIGKVCMDNADECPSYYCEKDARSSVDATLDFIEKLNTVDETGLLKPVITPRFIPTSSDDLLRSLGELARATGHHVQTHCSESDWEVGHTRNRFNSTDVEVLASFGLLTGKTVLAHCNHVSEGDLVEIKAVSSGVAHCPLSNFYFADAVFPARRALNMGIKVGLGTDISAGYSPSVLDSARTAIMAGRALQSGTSAQLAPSVRGVQNSQLSQTEAFWMATAGAGEVLEIPTGKFQPGYEFDAIVVDTQAQAGTPLVGLESDDSLVAFQRLFLLATRSNIVQTWVRGKKISESESSY